MRIVVCVKQVPDVAEIRIDEVTHTLVRAGVPSILNPFDEFAVEEALRIREKHGGTITAVSMGPLQAKEALFKCLAMGVDRAVLLTDVFFAGADTWATAKTLAMAIQKLGYDLIICGMKAVDGETSQVGPEIAELLGMPHISYVKRVEVEMESKSITAERMTEQGYQLIRATMPCLLTATKALNVPRIPTLLHQMAAKKKNVEIMKAVDIGAQREEVGLPGSRTQVTKVYTPQYRTGGGTILTSENLPNAVATLKELLKKERIV
ncbi:electron transfer flavoprotein subunit beta [archaeon RBG_16_50_20]|nr:MAG: electron transfer flavoprotein subunit beta [archaeon RBG_16_50_20]